MKCSNKYILTWLESMEAYWQNWLSIEKMSMTGRNGEGMFGSKRQSHVVELSQWSDQPLCKLCRHLPPPSNGSMIYRFGARRTCGPAGWLALLLNKTGDVENNPGPTTTHKQG